MIELLESEHLRHGRESNAHVVVYRHVRHAPPYLPNYAFLRPAYVHPLTPVKNFVYSDMVAFADAVVEVPEGASTAVVHAIDPAARRRPPWWMEYWRGLLLGAPTAVLVGAVDRIGPLGPTAAAVWLGLNWWLH